MSRQAVRNKSTDILPSEGWSNFNLKSIKKSKYLSNFQPVGTKTQSSKKNCKKKRWTKVLNKSCEHKLSTKVVNKSFDQIDVNKSCYQKMWTTPPDTLLAMFAMFGLIGLIIINFCLTHISNRKKRCSHCLRSCHFINPYFLGNNLLTTEPEYLLVMGNKLSLFALAGDKLGLVLWLHLYFVMNKYKTRQLSDTGTQH